MPRRKSVVALAGVLIAVGLSACGGDEEPEPSIPLEDAEALVATLDEVRENVEVQSCTVAAGKVEELQGEIDDLPSDVNSDVAEALDRGAQNLGGLVADQCEEEEPEPTTTDEPTTTNEDTEPTETQPPETEPTETQPTEPTTPTQEIGPGNNPGGGVGPGSDGL